MYGGNDHMKGKKRLTLARKQAWTGRMFVLPFYVGFLIFFARPLYQSILFIFNNIKIEVGGYSMEYIGFDSLVHIFTVDLNYSTNLITTVVQVLWQVPVILLVSIFCALLLNSSFRGRTFVRAVFFLPVIIVTGTVVTIMMSDSTVSGTFSGNVVAAGMVSDAFSLALFLFQLGIPVPVIIIALSVFGSLITVLWKTGVQIIILLAGLQSISPALYEASAIEGATAWENFFKITLPMLTPIITVVLVYSIIDTFMDSNNSVMNQVLTNSSALRLSFASAMAWVFFIVIAVILAIVFLSLSKINRKID